MHASVCLSVSNGCLQPLVISSYIEPTRWLNMYGINIKKLLIAYGGHVSRRCLGKYKWGKYCNKKLLYNEVLRGCNHL